MLCLCSGPSLQSNSNLPTATFSPAYAARISQPIQREFRRAPHPHAHTIYTRPQPCSLPPHQQPLLQSSFCWLLFQCLSQYQASFLCRSSTSCNCKLREIMATAVRCLLMTVAVVLAPLLAGGGVAAGGPLSTSFYSKRCPSVQGIVRAGMASAVAAERRMGASILRMFFHDCFVNGCDASILLDDTPTFTGEKNAGPNANSVRGYEVVDAIKAQVEAACNATVSCADILALAARDAVNLLGGPTWTVYLGRRDALTASQSDANANLPGPGSSLATLVSMFGGKGLSPRDMTALSGAHTVGQARCATFRDRIYTESNINATFAALRQQTCPQQAGGGGDGNLAPIDAQTPEAFDNAYYRNLMSGQGLFHSDQELFNGGSQDALVRKYGGNAGMFAADFAKAMVRMGAISPLTGAQGEVRLNCRKVN
ncbi:hypothetical protein PVAP13_4KG245400 [Panicum virgatum]|uniref:Peroxidase 1 n=2 Tax=Panicum virgatum TaxID=38727 RepID=A0A8T0TTG1_PANVG|nr:hypothetical protein PVAP13_4KG245400 [Panicum virgatum]